jgi:hypothetical protein
MDETTGRGTERRDHLIAVTTLADASFSLIAKAFQTVVKRNGDELRAGLVVAQISDRDVVEQAKIELAQLDSR